MAVTVLLADDHAIMRKAIAHLLASDPEIQLVAEAISFAQTMQLTSKLEPQVVVMDLHLSDEKKVTPSHVKSCLVDSLVLAMSIWDDDETKALAETFGAVMLLDKTNLATELIPAIRYYATYQDKRAGFGLISRSR
jgi:DNA-binding NarL/FixJ family response regulator